MQFTLRTLLLFVLVAWSTLAAFGVWGLVVGAWLALIVACFRAARKRYPVAGTLVAGLMLLSLCTFSVEAPVMHAYREAARRRTCRDNLRLLGLALNTYHDVHGCFPPAYVPGPDGTPWHSWRVLILPYMCYCSAYDQYRFDEPWNGPNNSKLAAECPREFLCPSDSGQGSLTTSYVALVGRETAWPGARGIRLEEIDDPEGTIVLVEVADSGIHWMEPRDLTLDEAMQGVQPEPGRGISSWHWPATGFLFNTEGAAQVVMADGTLGQITENTPPETLKSLLQLGGGKPVPEDWGELGSRPNWSRWVALATLVVSVLLLCWSTRPQAPRREGA